MWRFYDMMSVPTKKPVRSIDEPEEKKALVPIGRRPKDFNLSRVPAKHDGTVAQTGTVSSVDEEKPLANQAHALSAVPNWAIA